MPRPARPAPAERAGTLARDVRRAFPPHLARPAGVLAWAILLVAVAMGPATAQPAGAPAIPPARGHVNDVAGVMDPAGVARLEAFLAQVKKKTGAELAVLTMPTTAPMAPSEYKVKVFDAWTIGRADEDDGLLLLVAIEEREARFETGYGLEGTLPDGLQSRIFRREMQPRFREGDYTGGITAAMIECARRIGAERGVELVWDGEELRYSGRTGRRMPFWAVLLIFIVLAFAMASMGGGGFGGPRGRRGAWMGGPRGYGWGGGFGGAGGRGGGPFGGFGGGMSGGGGGGGRW